MESCEIGDPQNSMNCPSRLVLLPGLDGTGALFKPFLDLAPCGPVIEVLPLENQKPTSWQQQCELLAESLGSKPAIVIAESFSGRFAYELCLREDTCIHHVVFAATFLENPHWLTHLASCLPSQFLKGKWLPGWLLEKLLFHPTSTKELVRTFRENLEGVPPFILKNRIRQIAKMALPERPLTKPCTYLRAKKDRCVSHRATVPFQNLCPNLTLHEHESGHLLLQTQPEWVWRVVNRIRQLN